MHRPRCNCSARLCCLDCNGFVIAADRVAFPLHFIAVTRVRLYSCSQGAGEYDYYAAHRISRGNVGIDAKYVAFKNPDEAVKVANDIAADASHPPVVILALDSNAARILPILRRAGNTGPFLGGDALGDENLSTLMANAC